MIDNDVASRTHCTGRFAGAQSAGTVGCLDLMPATTNELDGVTFQTKVRIVTGSKCVGITGI